MDPTHMAMMAQRLANGRHLYCPNVSHLSLYDDQETYYRPPQPSQWSGERAAEPSAPR